MKVTISSKAEKNLRKLSKIDQIAVAQKIRFIRDGADLIREEKLTGFKDIYRVRIGNIRIVYRKRPSDIFIILIHHRKDVYNLLKQLLD